ILSGEPHRDGVLVVLDAIGDIAPEMFGKIEVQHFIPGDLIVLEPAGGGGFLGDVVVGDGGGQAGGLQVHQAAQGVLLGVAVDAGVVGEVGGVVSGVQG